MLKEKSFLLLFSFYLGLNLLKRDYSFHPLQYMALKRIARMRLFKATGFAVGVNINEVDMRHQRRLLVIKLCLYLGYDYVAFCHKAFYRGKQMYTF